MHLSLIWKGIEYVALKANILKRLRPGKWINCGAEGAAVPKEEHNVCIWSHSVLLNSTQGISTQVNSNHLYPIQLDQFN